MAPRYRRNQIRRAGKNLAADDVAVEQRAQALDALDYWRLAHLGIIASVHRVLDEVAREASCSRTIQGVDAEFPLVVSRVKRVDSIVGKLRRKNCTFQLDTMCDIAGCRVVVASVEEVYEVFDRLRLKDEIQIRTVNERDQVKDYIGLSSLGPGPKEDGYRSLHVIVECMDERFGYGKLLCEIQIRTELEHAWATALETHDIMAAEGMLKFGAGSDDARRFFMLASAAFALKEGAPEVPRVSVDLPEILDEINEIEGRCNILARLRACSGSVVIVNRHAVISEAKYCILQIDYEQQSTKIYVYPESQEAEASERFSILEREKVGMQDVLQVLVSSLGELEKAYPNYLSDISYFISSLDDLLPEEG